MSYFGSMDIKQEARGVSREWLTIRERRSSDLKVYLIEIEMPNYITASFGQEKFHKVALLPLPFRLIPAVVFQILQWLPIMVSTAH